MYVLTILKICELITRKVVRGEMTTIMQKYQWISYILKYKLINVVINKSKVDKLIENKSLRMDVSFIRIDDTNYPSYDKAPQQYKSSYSPPVINTCHVSRMFLQSIIIDISYCKYWNDIE